MDLDSILGRGATQGVAYAICYLQAEVEQRGLAMLVGDDENGVKVYLNEKEVYRDPPRSTVLGTHREVPGVVLNAGLNVLVFKAVSGPYGWGESICFTDAQGNPVKGVTVTLDPEAKEKTALKQP